MNGLALCAGAGGLELALHIADPGYRTVCYVEREARAAATLVARMADETLDSAPIWGDVTSFDGRRWRGVVDIVSGGYPCQGESNAGRKNPSPGMSGAAPAGSPHLEAFGGERSNAPFIDAGGHFRHPCRNPGCRREGSFGLGVSLRRYFAAVEGGDAQAARWLGRWWCAEHRPRAGRIEAEPLSRTPDAGGQGVLL